jgi:hypothetical protein
VRVNTEGEVDIFCDDVVFPNGSVITDVLACCETRGTPYACMLGGADRRTLYVCTSEIGNTDEAARFLSGHLEQVRVTAAGAGLQ